MTRPAPQSDRPRLNKQVEALKAYFRRHPDTWLTPEEASRVCGASASAVTSRLRDLRKAPYGGWTLKLRPRKGNLREYCGVPPVAGDQTEIFG